MFTYVADEAVVAATVVAIVVAMLVAAVVTAVVVTVLAAEVLVTDVVIALEAVVIPASFRKRVKIARRRAMRRKRTARNNLLIGPCGSGTGSGFGCASAFT